MAQRRNQPVLPESGADLARTMRRRLVSLYLLASAVGTGVVFTSVGFVGRLFLDEAEVDRLGRLNAVGIAAYVAIMAPLGIYAARRYNAPIERWLTSGEAPSEVQRRRALRLARAGVSITAAGWGLAAVLFALLNLAASVGFAACVGVTILLGGMTTCALSYLLTERTLRGITARALAAKPPSRPVALGVRGRLVMAWTLATAVPLLGILGVSVVALARADVGVQDVAVAVIFLAAVALTVGFAATLFAARSIADPVASVRTGLASVEEGDFDVEVEVDDGSEVGLLGAGFNRMAEGLRERERLRDLFGRHVGREVARAALTDDPELGGEEREVAALFIDLVGSTALAAERPPAAVVTILNEFFAVVVDVVESHGGLVNKFEGDAALCVFGAPVERACPAADALVAARELRARVAQDVADVDFGVGVSAGRAVAGNVGAEERFEYTVIGDPINEAARLSDLAKRRPERLLASEAAVRRAGDPEAERWSLGEAVALRGRAADTRLATAPT